MFYLLQLARPLGPPPRSALGPHGPWHGPLHGAGDAGPQYLLCIAVWCLALLLVRASVRGSITDFRHRVLTAGFAAGLTREVFSLSLQFLGPRAMRALLPPGVLPAIEAWVQGAAVIVLIGGFLAYLVDEPSVARRYLKLTLPLHGAAFAVVVAGFLASPRLEVLGLRRDVIVAGLVALSSCGIAAGLGVALRSVRKDPERWIMAAGIGFFLVSIGVRGLAFFGLYEGLRPPVDVPYSVTSSAIGVVMLGYLFVRTHSAEVRADMTELEEQVRHRTAHLEAALEELAVANSKLVEQSTIDSLTGAYNRRFFDEALSEEWARAARTGSPLALALVDLDRFKEINDRCGHPKGDECLLYVAGTLQGRLRRPGDVVARYGGDEFVVLLPNTSEADAATVLESVRLEIANPAHAPTPGLTVSIGVAASAPQAGEDPETLMHRADERLYAAKQCGRNCVGAGEPQASEIA